VGPDAQDTAAPRPSALLADLRRTLPAMVEDIKTLVSCESPSTDLDAVARSAQIVAAIGAAHLGPPEMLAIDGCMHLRWTFGPGPQRVLVLGHHDTVWPIGSVRRHPVTAQQGILRGPGCLDMKAGVVMAFRALAAAGNLQGVTLLITGDEEIGSRTSRALIEAEARNCGAVLVLEAASAGGALKLQRKGRAHYTVAIEGRAAHAGLEPERGINAAVELAHQVLAVQGLSDTAAGTTITPSLVAGGNSANTVPETASFTVDVRALSIAELERVDAATRALRPVLTDARLEIAGGLDRPPLEADMSAELFRLAAELAASIGIDDLRGTSVGGGSDGNLTAALGIPTLDGLGAVGDGIHAPHEHVIIDELPRRTALVALLVARLIHDRMASAAAAV
jgi:glutamate carboxypeptidase